VINSESWIDFRCGTDNGCIVWCTWARTVVECPTVSEFKWSYHTVEIWSLALEPTVFTYNRVKHVQLLKIGSNKINLSCDKSLSISLALSSERLSEPIPLGPFPLLLAFPPSV
jgi:hypothetical protein